MKEELQVAFPTIRDKELSDSYIEEHPDPMWDVPEIPLIRAIPLYMLWCIENRTSEGALVIDGTIQALNKYGRAKNAEIEWQNFRFKCNEHQIEAVLKFLYWCKNSLVLDYEPALSRAIKNWKNINS
jgi:hypothetical protein